MMSPCFCFEILAVEKMENNKMKYTDIPNNPGGGRAVETLTILNKLHLLLKTCRVLRGRVPTRKALMVPQKLAKALQRVERAKVLPQAKVGLLQRYLALQSSPLGGG